MQRGALITNGGKSVVVVVVVVTIVVWVAGAKDSRPIALFGGTSWDSSPRGGSPSSCLVGARSGKGGYEEEGSEDPVDVGDASLDSVLELSSAGSAATCSGKGIIYAGIEKKMVVGKSISEM